MLGKDWRELQKVLQKFGKEVVRLSRYNLTRGKHNVSGDLYNSIKAIETSSETGGSIQIVMDEYGDFVNEGVHGTKSSYVTARSSPYRYKESSALVGLEYHTGIFSKWAKKKNIRLRDDLGKFKKGNYKSIGFIIARSIKEKGIKPTFFLTKAYNAAFRGLDFKIGMAAGKDIKRELIKESKTKK